MLSIFCFAGSKGQWKMVYDSGYASVDVFIDGGNIFSTNDKGLMISRNNGKNWALVDTSNDMRHSRILVRKDSLLLATTYSGIYHSLDSGMTWHLAGKWPTWGSNFNGGFLIGNALLALSSTDRVIRSLDFGATWDSSSNGLPSTKYGDSKHPSMRIFSGYAASGNNVLAFSDFDEYISYDRGENWHFKESTIPFITYKFISVGSKVFAGWDALYMSSDSGGSWGKVFSPKQSIDDMGGFSSNGSVILCRSTGEGVLLSKDSGVNWIFINDGLSNLNIVSTAIGGSYIYCTALYGKIFIRDLSSLLGVQEHSQKNDLVNLKVYPNPLSQSTTFEFGRDVHNAQLTIYDMTGKIIRQYSNIHASKFEMQRESMANGMYLYLLVEGSRNLSMGKIIIIEKSN